MKKHVPIILLLSTLLVILALMIVDRFHVHAIQEELAYYKQITKEQMRAVQQEQAYEEIREQVRTWTHLVHVLSEHIDRLYAEGYVQAVVDIGEQGKKFCVWDGKLTSGEHLRGAVIYSSGLGPAVQIGAGATGVQISESMFYTRKGFSKQFLIESSDIK